MLNYFGKKIRQHSRYWLGEYFYTEKVDKKSAAYLMKLANVRRGVSNFVRILTGSDIPVHFSSGQQSYTDGDKVVVISATDDVDKFDSMVGLALHEASHVKLTQDWFVLVRAMIQAPAAIIPANIYALGMTLQRDPTKVLNDVKLCLNFLEDRRIDAWVYETAPGYRPYYEANYERFFYSPMIDEALASPEFRVPALKAYEMHLINMFSDKADPDALPGLRKIWEIINLPNITRYNDDIRWPEYLRHLDKVQHRFAISKQTLVAINDEMPLILQDALRIVQTIYENAQLLPDPKMNQMSEQGEPDEDFSDLPNYDMPQPGEGEGEGEGDEGKEGKESDKDGTNAGGSKAGKGKPAKLDLDKLLKALRKQNSYLNGNVQKDKLDEKDVSTLNNLEASDADLREAGSEISKKTKAKVILYKNVTKDVVAHPSFPFANQNGYGAESGKPLVCPDAQKAVTDGFRMGEVLAHRLRVMNDESTMTFNRQKVGHIDKRMIASLGFGYEQVFSRTQTMRIKPVMVDLSIDASGSMSGNKWGHSLTLAVALAVAASKTRTMRVRINIRAGDHGTAHVAIVYDSKKDKIAKIREVFPYLHAEGGTPEGLCFEAMLKEILEEVKQTRRFFVNLSDGEPAHGWSKENGYYDSVNYSGEPAARHTRMQVDEIRKAGIKVLSYFITAYKGDAKQMQNNKKSLFHMMYGNDATYVDPTSITEVATTLNRLFLSAD
jgi:hypothetical protein